MGDNLSVRRALVMVGVWALGVVIAVAVAFAAVDRVASGVTPKDGARLSQAAIDQELRLPGNGTGAASTVATSTSRSTSTTRVPSMTVTTTTPTTFTAVPPPTSPKTTTSPTTTPSPNTDTTISSSMPVASNNTVTTSQGGTLFTRCSGPDQIVFVASVPKSGYQRTVDGESSGGVRQSFQNAMHRSNIEAECSNGVVRAHVEEESADG